MLKLELILARLFSKMKLPRVYLAGHYFEKEYRRYVSKEYSSHFKIILPIEIDYKKYWKIVVQHDKRQIRRCDIVVVFLRKPTFGTIMEIMYAYMKKKPVYFINPNRMYINDVWVKYHVKKSFFSIDECFQFLIEKYSKKKNNKKRNGGKNGVIERRKEKEAK